jgi:hypothetical protein
LYQSIASIENILSDERDKSEEVIYLDKNHPSDKKVLEDLRKEVKNIC